MNPEAQKKSFSLTQKKVLIIVLIAVTVLIFAIIAQLAYMVFAYDNTYRSVYIDDIYAGNMSKADLKALVQKNFKDKEKTNELTLKFKDSTVKLNYSDINLKYDTDKAVENAYGIGRKGNVFERTADVIKASLSKQVVEVPITYDKDKLSAIIDSLYQKTNTSVKDPELVVQEDRVLLRSGHQGAVIEKDKALNEIVKALKYCKTGTLELSGKITKQASMDADEYYKKLNVSMSNASFKIENDKLIVTPEVIGRSINKDELEASIKEIDGKDDIEKILPVKITQPEVTAKGINEKLFKDELGGMTTWFPTNDEINRNRANNIRLAVGAISGKMILPGETFSFNGIVGRRTHERGYRDAYVYQNGKQELDVGGGVCQVSSTLYNCVLLADLPVLERYNHYFTIGYVPLGRDAAVASASDFKFKNDTNYPIRVDAWTGNDNSLHFSLKGTNEHPTKTVEIYPQTVRKIDFKKVYTDDPNVNEGTETVKQPGSPGFVVDTYVTVKENGKIIKSGKIHTSTYVPHDNEIIKGTKKVPGQTPATPTQPPSTQTPVTPPIDGPAPNNNPPQPQ